MNARNIRLDLLRIFGMLGIVLLHILGVGGVRSSLDPASVNFWIAYGVGILAECSVNIFAVMSGYLLFGKKQKMKRLVELLTTVLFYSILITVIVLICFDVEFSAGNMLMAILPVLRGKYWYITCYAGLFILFPYLNILIEHLERRQCIILLISMTIVFSILPNLMAVDLFGMENGYSVAWLAIGYIFGACWKKFEFKIFESREWCVVIISSVCLFVIKLIIYMVLHKDMDYFLTYTSPFVLLNAVMLLQHAARGEKSAKNRISKVIFSLSSFTFDVYIIHAHVWVFQYIMKGGFSWIAGMKEWLFFPVILVSGVLIFMICYPVAVIRAKLFSVARIDNIIALIGNKLDSLMAWKNQDWQG